MPPPLPPLPPAGQEQEQEQEQRGALPALPVAELSAAAQILRRSVSPFLAGQDRHLNSHAQRRKQFETVESLRQAAEFDALLGDFVRPGGAAERLRAQLVERQRNAAQEGSHWLESWWDTTYFAPRNAISIWVNFYFDLEGVSTTLVAEQSIGDLSRQTYSAAVCVEAMCKFHCALQHGEVPPDSLKGKPLDMESFRFMFGACRVAVRDGMDRLELHADDLPPYGTKRTTPMSSVNHIVVSCHGYLFEITALEPADGSETGLLVPAPAARLAQRLRAVRQRADELYAASGLGPGVGVVTSEPRDRDAEMHDLLRAHSARNATTLDRVASSLFFVALDDTAPENATVRVNALLHGPAENRWFDKSLQLIVFSDGQVGLNGEHSKLDGLPVAALCDTMYRAVQTPASLSNTAVIDGGMVAELGIDVSGDLASELDKSRQSVQQHVDMFRLVPLHFKDFGMDQIKKFGISPDAFVQECLQLSYARSYDRIAASYESGATKTFFKGRTEVVRACTEECVVWVQSMAADSDVPDAERYRLLIAAGSAHTEYMKAAVKNAACDRLFFGLKNQALENGEALHPIFSHPVMAASTNWRLSTSQLASKTESFSVGYGPAVDEGFGVCYCPRRASMKYEISSFAADPVSAADFASTLTQVMKEVALLCAREAPPPKAKM